MVVRPLHDGMLTTLDVNYTNGDKPYHIKGNITPHLQHYIDVQIRAADSLPKQLYHL